MARKVFAVVLDKPQPQVEERLEKNYARPYCYTDTFYLVAVDQHVSIEDAARTLGIKGTNRDATGAVFKLNAAYAGFTRKEMWEWLSDAVTV